MKQIQRVHSSSCRKNHPVMNNLLLRLPSVENRQIQQVSNIPFTKREGTTNHYMKALLVQTWYKLGTSIFSRRRAEYTVRNVETTTALFRANTLRCTRKSTSNSYLLLFTPCKASNITYGLSKMVDSTVPERAHSRSKEACLQWHKSVLKSVGGVGVDNIEICLHYVLDFEHCSMGG